MMTKFRVDVMWSHQWFQGTLYIGSSKNWNLSKKKKNSKNWNIPNKIKNGILHPFDPKGKRSERFYK
jgi:hypothetical protein